MEIKAPYQLTLYRNHYQILEVRADGKLLVQAGNDSLGLPPSQRLMSWEEIDFHGELIFATDYSI